MVCNFADNPEKCVIYRMRISCKDCIELGYDKEVVFLTEQYEQLKYSWLSFQEWFLKQRNIITPYNILKNFKNIKHFINELFGFEKAAVYKEELSLVHLLKFHYFNQFSKETIDVDKDLQ